MEYGPRLRGLSAKRTICYTFLSGLLALTIAAFVTRSNSGPAEKDGSPLLSREAVSRILGMPFREPHHQVRKDPTGKTVLSSFTFVPVKEAAFSSLNLLVIPRHDDVPPAEAVRRYILSLRTGMGDEDPTLVPVADVGEAALYDPSMGQLVVFQGRRLLVFTLHHQRGHQTESLLVQLAQAALHT